MLETVNEPPFGWWPDTPSESAQFTTERTDPAVITETDISDPERETMSRWYACAECGTPTQAIESADGYDDDVCHYCVHGD